MIIVNVTNRVHSGSANVEGEDKQGVLIQQKMALWINRTGMYHVYSPGKTANY